MPEDIVTEVVSFRANGGTADGFLARPASGEPHLAVIVIQEWWGLDSHIKDISERLARLGFAVIAPDLYHGQVTSEPDEARKLAMALEYERAAKEIDGAGRWLLQQPYARGPRFGCIGYCMGGGLVLTTAIRNHDVGAAIVYYGGLPNPHEQLQAIEAPVLAFYGNDEAERARQLQDVLRRHNKSIELHIYQGARHGFFNDSNASGFNLAASYDSWPRAIRFLQNSLE